MVTLDSLQGKHKHGLISIKQILSAVSHCKCQPETCAPLWPALFKHLTDVHTSLHFTLTDRQEFTARIIMCSYREYNIDQTRPRTGTWLQLINAVKLFISLLIYVFIC